MLFNTASLDRCKLNFRLECFATVFHVVGQAKLLIRIIKQHKLINFPEISKLSTALDWDCSDASQLALLWFLF